MQRSFGGDGRREERKLTYSNTNKEGVYEVFISGKVFKDLAILGKVYKDRDRIFGYLLNF